jgi:hypothetical protein
MTPSYPANHQPGMRVPKGGSSCSSCKYLSENGKECTSEFFIKWHGTDKLPAPANEYCSDWYEPRTSETKKDYFFDGA